MGLRFLPSNYLVFLVTGPTLSHHRISKKVRYDLKGLIMNTKRHPVPQEPPRVLGALCQEWGQRQHISFYDAVSKGDPSSPVSVRLTQGRFFSVFPRFPQDIFEPKALTAGLRLKQ